MACRVYRRDVWATRIMLEACDHEESWFITLTYDDKHLPPGGSLQPRDMTLFLKKLRNAGMNFRYFYSGEYGELYERPHYHMILFGPAFGQLKEIARIWGNGYMHYGELNMTTAGYSASYIQKGMGKADDKRLKGRHPEFSRMSRRPGLGFNAIEELGRLCTSFGGAKHIAATGDVPKTIRMDGRLRAIGRYLRDKLRDRVGVNDADIDPLKQLSQDAHELLTTIDWRPLRLKADNRRLNAANKLASRSRIHKREAF